MDEHDDCACRRPSQHRARRMRRGDTLTFQLQVVLDQRTGEYLSLWPGEPVPRECQPVDLTGWHVTSTAKEEAAEWDNMAAFQLDNLALGGVTLVNAPEGWVQVQVPSLATAHFPDGPVRLTYDVQCVDPQALVRTPETGTLTVWPDMTRANA